MQGRMEVFDECSLIILLMGFNRVSLIWGRRPFPEVHPELITISSRDPQLLVKEGHVELRRPVKQRQEEGFFFTTENPFLGLNPSWA